VEYTINHVIRDKAIGIYFTLGMVSVVINIFKLDISLLFYNNNTSKGFDYFLFRRLRFVIYNSNPN